MVPPSPSDSFDRGDEDDRSSPIRLDHGSHVAAGCLLILYFTSWCEELTENTAPANTDLGKCELERSFSVRSSHGQPLGQLDQDPLAA